MASQPTDPNVFETANAGFAQAVYEDYLKNPETVSSEWRRLFESGVVGERPPVTRSENGAPKAAAPPVIPEAGTPIKGPAARLVANMTESLSIPTATTFREFSVSLLESRRGELNRALSAAGRREKISFTHLIGYAIVRAAVRHPVMGTSLQTVDGAPYRHTPGGVNLGLAVDVTRKDGSRGLVVPVLNHADGMTFAAFHSAYESIVEKARTNKLMPDEFVGATMTLTNPGGLGTVASVPRLMMGQGSIIAVGAIVYPAEFATVSAEKLTEFGISKVMTVTSTYDHRVIQGAESGDFLRSVEQLLQGHEGFYEHIATSLAVALGTAPSTTQRVVAPAPELPAGLGGGASARDLADVAAAMGLVKAYRTHGHLAAHLDPLGSEPIGDPALDPTTLGLTPEIMARIPASVLRVAVPGRTLADALPNLQATYCGTMAYEVEHISNHQERVWLRAQIESGAHRQPLDAEAKRRLFERLTQVETFERFLHKAYLGQKRFSIEGVDMLIPMLDLVIETAGDAGVREVVLGMAHRGRLNVLTHTIGRPYVTIFAEFEGGKQHPSDEPDIGTGDVKYHHGAEGAYVTRSGKAITVALAHNPSHLEFVGAVVSGQARARQTQRRGREPVVDAVVAIPVVIHGDAAFAGQGVVQETLNLGALKGYKIGGTIHLITNNQVGFTTDVTDARSTRHASDLAKGFDIPIIHVNADDPEACLAAVRLAMMYRTRFHEDMLIDLVGYRRHGHNEGDEPSYTQPLMYARIKDLPTVRQRYAFQLAQEAVVTEAEAEAQFTATYQHLVDIQQGFKASVGQSGKTDDPTPKTTPWQEVGTAILADVARALNQQLLTTPEGFTVNPKLKRQLERRGSALGPEGGIDWAQAEALALASLLTEGVPIRFTGQDCERGTFSHRHLVLHDAVTGTTYTPMQRLPGALATFELHNSPLSELATLGFEYGYSTTASESLVLWEAQFGDFINGAQVIVDQFLVAGYSKWGLTCRLTLLLPHGYEGQGPEHSSARLERFLQLAAEGNIRIANCTTPAQYFHLLRRQARRQRQRPLILFTPKSLLRHPLATSALGDLTSGTFEPVLDDASAIGRAGDIRRLVLCSGKVYYDLLAEAQNRQTDRPAIARLEQLYSLPEGQLRTLIARYPNLQEIIWAQEEPQNMGAWTYLAPRLTMLLPSGVGLQYAGRPERASPAEGKPAVHATEQARLVREALG